MWYISFGESHGKGIGVVIGGIPAGIPVSEQEIDDALKRRRPGQSIFVSQRVEPDKCEILSGVFENKTTGAPFTVFVKNRDIKSSDYDYLRNIPRPGHADLTYYLKYGIYDYRGGGSASGRETIARVIAGYIAKKIIKPVEIAGHVVQIGKIKVEKELSFEEILRAEESPVRCAVPEISREMEKYILELIKSGDSSGGIVELVARNVPPGLGEPIADKLDAEIARALMSIGAVKGIEIGAGFRVSEMKGSENNDEITIKENKPVLKTNNCGGILGGISTGTDVRVRIAVKPTPSISILQDTVNLKTAEKVRLRLRGRHDPCICPRIVAVAESMLAIVLADFFQKKRATEPWDSVYSGNNIR